MLIDFFPFTCLNLQNITVNPLGVFLPTVSELHSLCCSWITSLHNAAYSRLELLTGARGQEGLCVNGAFQVFIFYSERE